MNSGGGSTSGDGMYSQLIEDELRLGTGTGTEEGSAVTWAPRPRGPAPGLGPASRPYRLATACLAALCAVLLVCVIALAAHGKSRPAGGAGVSPDVQKQQQEANATALSAAILSLREEKRQLQEEKEELQRRLSALLATTAPPVVCPLDWHQFNGSCYFISRVSRDWDESRSYCQSKGGDLAIILTAQEQTFLWDLLPRGHWNAYWFGITDGHTEDQWKWVDGTPLIGPGFWEEGEPNNHINEDCGYMIKTRVLERVAVRSWYDAPCTMACPYICEKELVPGAGTALPH